MVGRAEKEKDEGVNVCTMENSVLIVATVSRSTTGGMPRFPGRLGRVNTGPLVGQKDRGVTRLALAVHVSNRLAGRGRPKSEVDTVSVRDGLILGIDFCSPDFLNHLSVSHTARNWADRRCVFKQTGGTNRRHVESALSQQVSLPGLDQSCHLGERLPRAVGRVKLITHRSVDRLEERGSGR